MADEFGTDAPDVGVEILRGDPAQRDHAVLAALALPDHQKPGLQIHVIEREAQKLVAPDTGGVKHFQDHAVTVADGGVDIGLAQQFLDLGLREDRLGQALGRAGIFKIACRVVGDSRPDGDNPKKPATADRH